MAAPPPATRAEPAFWTFPPVVLRELRVEARRALTRGLRIAGGLLGILALAPLCVRGVSTPSGVAFFAALHVAALAVIVLAGPLLTADCISRERREGTLPLLFLTPLSATGVILAKATVRVLRASQAWLAIVPAACLAFLLGGVTWLHAAMAFLTDRFEFDSLISGEAASMLLLAALQGPIVIWAFRGLHRSLRLRQFASHSG